MTLGDYLAVNEITPADFARSIAVNERESVRRYLNGSRTPNPKIMRRIYAVTKGQVTANDFFDLGTPLAGATAQAER